MIAVYIIIGIVLGVFLTIKIKSIISKSLVSEKKTYKMTFHLYFPVFEVGNSKSAYVETRSVNLLINADTEENAAKYLKDMILSEVKIEIEKIEKI